MQLTIPYTDLYTTFITMLNGIFKLSDKEIKAAAIIYKLHDKYGSSDIVFSNPVRKEAATLLGISLINYNILLQNLRKKKFLITLPGGSTGLRSNIIPSQEITFKLYDKSAVTA